MAAKHGTTVLRSDAALSGAAGALPRAGWSCCSSVGGAHTALTRDRKPPDHRCPQSSAAAHRSPATAAGCPCSCCKQTRQRGPAGQTAAAGSDSEPAVLFKRLAAPTTAEHCAHMCWQARWDMGGPPLGPDNAGLMQPGREGCRQRALPSMPRSSPAAGAGPTSLPGGSRRHFPQRSHCSQAGAAGAPAPAPPARAPASSSPSSAAAAAVAVACVPLPRPPCGDSCSRARTQLALLARLRRLAAGASPPAPPPSSSSPPAAAAPKLLRVRRKLRWLPTLLFRISLEAVAAASRGRR